MLKYDDFLKNDLIIKEYSKIDKVNPYAFSHGLQHINNVCNNMKLLCKVLNIDKEMEDSLLIACVLHDVGQANGRENHGLKAKEITQKLFGKELKENKYYEEILYSIATHDNKNTSDEPLFSLLLKCADTLDFTKKRLVANCKDKNLYKVWEDINDITLNIKNPYFILNIITNSKDNFKEKFLAENFTKKIFASVTNLANYLKLKAIIQIDGIEI